MYKKHELDKISKNVSFKNIDKRSLLISAALIVFVLASMLPIQPITAGTPPNLGISSSTQTLNAGSSNGVTFTITNYGDTSANQIFVALSLPSSATGGALMILTGSDGKWYIDSLNAGQSASISVSISTSAAAAGNAYSLRFDLSYLVNSTIANTTNQKVDTRYIGVNVPLLQTNGASLATNFTSNQIVAGQNNNLNLTIKNVGDTEADGVSVSLVMPGAVSGTSPLSLVGSDGKWTFNKIATNGSVSIPLTIYAAPSSSGQTYQVAISLTYSDYIRQKVETRYLMLNVPVEFGPSATIDVLLSTSDLVSGSVNNLNMTVTNNGDAPADAVSVSITTSGVQGGSTSIALINSDGTYTLGRMAPGEQRTIPIMLFVNPIASGTVTSLTVTTSYTDMGYKLKQQVNYLGMIIRGNVNLVILDTSTYPSNITLGSPFTLTVSMINLGTVSAQSAIIMPNGTAEIQPISSNKVFLGDLAVNVPSSFTIPFIASNIVSGNYNLTLAYSYKDSLGGSFVNYLYIPFTLTVASNATTQDQGQGTQGSLLGTLFAWLPYIVIAIAIIIVLYLLLRRRRRSRSGQ
jgi:hypothetical protein